LSSSNGHSQIQLRGVSVHNLDHIDLDLPHHQLIAICGVSGSGKTSLALDTLYAEGQRRYIESFSAYTRQFLDRLEKPAADRIDGIPAAIAVARKNTSRSSRSTIGTSTEIADYLRLLFAKIGSVHCLSCGHPVRRDTDHSVAEQLEQLEQGTRYMVGFELAATAVTLCQLPETGFVRVIHDGKSYNLADETGESLPDQMPGEDEEPIVLTVVVDRLVAGQASSERLRDSLEIIFDQPQASCVVLVAAEEEDESTGMVDGRPWRRQRFSASLRCESCQQDYPDPEPRLFSFNSPLGACPECEGFGNIIDIDMELVVPDASKSIREGAIAPWSTPAYKHELEELLELAEEYDLPVDVPYSELKARHRKIITGGVKERDFGGLDGFFAWLERRKYKMHLRVFLSRWRSYGICPGCQGARLRTESLAWRVGGLNIAEISAMKISDACKFFDKLDLEDAEKEVSGLIREQLQSRLHYLEAVGLDYLSLDRTLRTLSGGEAQRVNLTTALGSSLVNMLYVLDEPTVGLHPQDVDRLSGAIRGLCDRGNTVVVVEHEESMLQVADQLVEIGPGAGDRGGRVVFQGDLAAMMEPDASLTGEYLSGRRGIRVLPQRREPKHGWIRLSGARGNNLKNLSVKFPLGVLCLVTGVSGSGKSTLVQDTLYGALCRRKKKDSIKPLPFDDVVGDGQIEEVILVDQSPIGRSPRSNPVTYIKAFDPIRAVFADTVEARTHNYSAGHFSFNVDGGRCSACKGDGHIEIDMQFLADVYMKCGQCGGTRYRKEILEVKYRGKNIADVLNMTVRGAFSFFRGQAKVQTKLKQLMDVGLDYLRLGQPANTLSSGESQRLKLAAHMSKAKRRRTLFILDEPTTGLHFSDVIQLLDCFDALLAVGHSLIVVEHNLQLMKAADYIIDLGPGAADLGGEVVATGRPEEVVEVPESRTGQFLQDALRRDLLLSVEP
jgi:excinuclease ABC subunit A